MGSLLSLYPGFVGLVCRVGWLLYPLLRMSSVLKFFVSGFRRVLIVGEGLRAVQNGGVYVNGQQVQVGATVTQLLAEGEALVIRFGRNKFRIVEILSEEEDEIELYAKEIESYAKEM